MPEAAPADEQEKAEVAPEKAAEITPAPEKVVTPEAAPVVAPKEATPEIAPAPEKVVPEAAPADEQEKADAPSTPETVTPVQPEPSAEPSTKPAETQSHTVQRGETLYSIARKYRQSTRDIASWNNFKYPYRLEVGKRLVVSPPNTSKVPASEKAKAVKRDFHLVRQGETLYRISRRYGVSMSEITAWNNLQDNSLSVGQKLWVSAPNGTVPPQLF